MEIIGKIQFSHCCEWSDYMAFIFIYLFVRPDTPLFIANHLPQVAYKTKTIIKHAFFHIKKYNLKYIAIKTIKAAAQ